MALNHPRGDWLPLAPLPWAPSGPWRVPRSLGGASATRLTLPGGRWLKVGGWLLTVPPPGGKNSTSVPEKKKTTKTQRLIQTRIATGDGFKNRNTCLRIVTGNEISEMPLRGCGGRGWAAAPPLRLPCFGRPYPQGKWCPPRLASSRSSQAGPWGDYRL